MLQTVNEKSVTSAHIDAFIRLVRATYGETYGQGWIYCRETIQDRIAKGEIRLILIMRMPKEEGIGDLLGSAVLNFCYPTRELVSCGGLMIAPNISASQSGATLKLITENLSKMAMKLAHKEGLRAMTVNAVTRHTLTQRLIEMIGFTSTGLLPGLVPANEEIVTNPALDRAYSMAAKRTGTSERKRLSEIIAVRPIRSFTKPYQITNPTRLAHFVEDVYQGLRLPVTLTPAKSSAQVTKPEWSGEHLDSSEPQRRIARFEVITPGHNSGEVLQGIARKWQTSGNWDTALVTLPFCEHIDALVNPLLDEGFTFGAVYPKYRASRDVLVLQRVNRSTYCLHPEQIYDEIARRLYASLCA